jgi:hypothetical protein
LSENRRRLAGDDPTQKFTTVRKPATTSLPILRAEPPFAGR